MAEYKEFLCGSCKHKVDVFVSSFEFNIGVGHNMYYSAYAYHDEVCKCSLKSDVTTIVDRDGKVYFRKENGKWTELLKKMTIEINNQNLKLLNGILKHGFLFGGDADPVTLDEVIRKLCRIADDEGYIDLDWENE